MWRNSATQYGWISRGFHWLLAMLLIGLLALGLWMVELDYYHRWYRTAPDLHRSVGVVAVLLMLARLLWLRIAGKPRAPAGHRRWEELLARVGHGLFYLLVVALGISGYLMSTADGRAVAVFDLVSIPAVGAWIDNQEDVMGEVHEVLAYSFIVLVVVHVLAVCKHQWIDRDRSLRRMI